MLKHKKNQHAKNLKVFALILLTSALLLAMINSGTPVVKAQASDTVVILSSLGGTTSPVEGSYNYTDGTAVTLTATAGVGFIFSYWVFSDSVNSSINYDNPATLIVNSSMGTYTVQATYTPVQEVAGTPVVPYPIPATAAIVVIVADPGGTTSPPPGTYALASAAAFDITAIPDSGWAFHNWVISGTPLTHGVYAFTDTPTNNPYNVNHGYGNTYTYSAYFVPITPTVTAVPTPTPTPSPTVKSDTDIIIALIVVLVIVVVVFGVYAYTRRSKK